jgi:Ca2+-binding EF-hand superfamily protein
LKENINTIILNILRNEYPYKNEIELNKMKNDLIKSELPPEKIQQIVEALFDEKGKEVLFDKINKEINNKKAIVMKNSKINGKYSREEINKINAQKQNECNFIQYDFLLDICLEYQIKLHIKYLKPFLKLFQSIDEDRDGVLNEDQFIELVKNLNLFGEENIEQVIDEFLNNIDPYRNNHITFSDIVDLLSKINYDESQTILDKFCLKDISSNINNNNNNMNNSNNNDNNINNHTNNEDNNEKNNSSSKKGIKKINEDIIK